jgi:hypothetical protein
VECPDFFSFLKEFGSSVVGAAVGAYLGAHFAFQKSREQKLQQDHDFRFNTIVSAHYCLYSNYTIMRQLSHQLMDVKSKAEAQKRHLCVVEISSRYAELDLQKLVPVLFATDRTLIAELRQAELTLTDALNLHHQRNQWVKDHLEASYASNDQSVLCMSLAEKIVNAEDHDLPRFIENACGRLVSAAVQLNDVMIRDFGVKLDSITEIKPSQLRGK